MASKSGGREIIHVQSSESSHEYTTMKNKRNTSERMRIRKYDPVIQQHVEYVEKR